MGINQGVGDGYIIRSHGPSTVTEVMDFACDEALAE